MSEGYRVTFHTTFFVHKNDAATAVDAEDYAAHLFSDEFGFFPHLDWFSATVEEVSSNA